MASAAAAAAVGAGLVELGDVAAVACGDSHSAFLTRQGDLLLCGSYRVSNSTNEQLEQGVVVWRLFFICLPCGYVQFVCLLQLNLLLHLSLLLLLHLLLLLQDSSGPLGFPRWGEGPQASRQPLPINLFSSMKLPVKIAAVVSKRSRDVFFSVSIPLCLRLSVSLSPSLSFSVPG